MVDTSQFRVTQQQAAIPDNIESQYLDLMQYILENGQDTDDRTGVGTLSAFGHQISADMSHGFPLLTTKRVYWKGVVGELLWFISGDTNIKWLQEQGIKIWDEWSDENGDLGPVYGKWWRDWNGIDQLQNVIDQIKTNPNSRRHIVTAWNPERIEEMALPPCHMMYQFNVRGEYLDLQLYQRSADMFLGVPFNIASYSLLLHMVAKITGLKPGEFIHTFGDVHIYKNHIDQCVEQLSREQKAFPQLGIKGQPTSIDEFTLDSVYLLNYNPHPTIKAPVAV